MTEYKKKPNPIDIHVGSRIRLRRKMLGMSQEKLGENLGITFQQIQKYEKGTNRVGASRLQAISSILGVPVAFFFEDAPEPNQASSQADQAMDDASPDRRIERDEPSSKGVLNPLFENRDNRVIRAETDRQLRQKFFRAAVCDMRD